MQRGYQDRASYSGFYEESQALLGQEPQVMGQYAELVWLNELPRSLSCVHILTVVSIIAFRSPK